MTGIEWTDTTWNPTTGCDRVSPGCDNCYALTMAGRLKAMGQVKYQRDGDPRTSGPGFGLTTHADALDLPLRWRKPRRVFVNSMSDLFHPEVPDEFIAEVFGVMATCQWTFKEECHTFQVLTKRPQRMASLLNRQDWWDHVWAVEDSNLPGIDRSHLRLPYTLRNVWLGVSIENNRYTWRANHLRATPAAVRFLSLEPLIGPLPSLDLTGIDWVIVGAESGRGARPMDMDVVQECRDQDGRAYLDDSGEIAVEIAVYPVGSPSPREAFEVVDKDSATTSGYTGKSSVSTTGSPQGS